MATRVGVVARDHASTITDCLDGLSEQGAERVDVVVVVVDHESSGRVADIGIHHPLPRRVVVVASDNLDRVMEAATPDAPGGRILLLGADRRPEPGWLDAALDALEHAPVIFGPDHDPGNLAVDRSRLGPLSFEAGDTCELIGRVRAAGANVGVAPGMRTARAEHRMPDTTSLPEMPATGAPPGAFTGKVSIVLCTRDRLGSLARCLASLDRLDDHDHEIIVVDNHDQPSVGEASLPDRARVVYEPRRGLDRARNRGMDEANGDVVVYVDDDCEVDPRWLTEIRAGFADPVVRAVTGRVRPAGLGAPSHRWFEAHFSFDRGTKAQRYTPWDSRPWYPTWSGSVGAGCNMAFRRDELIAVGGFDELLDMGTTIGGGGDLDVFVRVLDRGSIIEYRPDALVWHHHRSTEQDVRRQFFGYGVAVGAMVTKSILDRRGQRVNAARFYLDRLRIALRLLRQSRAGAHVVPVRLLLIDTAGQLVGPVVYLAARLRGRGDR